MVWALINNDFKKIYDAPGVQGRKREAVLDHGLMSAHPLVQNGIKHFCKNINNMSVKS